MSTFRTKNIPKKGPFEAGDKAQQLLNNSKTTFGKSRKWVFLTPKMIEHGCQFEPKRPILNKD